jgi:hypothetical protein
MRGIKVLVVVGLVFGMVSVSMVSGVAQLQFPIQWNPNPVVGGTANALKQGPNVKVCSEGIAQGRAGAQQRAQADVGANSRCAVDATYEGTFGVGPLNTEVELSGKLWGQLMTLTGNNDMVIVIASAGVGLVNRPAALFVQLQDNAGPGKPLQGKRDVGNNPQGLKQVAQACLSPGQYWIRVTVSAEADSKTFGGQGSLADANALFELKQLGVNCTPTTVVPTLTEWGLLALAVLLAGSLAFMIRRRLAPRPAGA